MKKGLSLLLALILLSIPFVSCSKGNGISNISDPSFNFSKSTESQDYSESDEESSKKATEDSSDTTEDSSDVTEEGSDTTDTPNGTVETTDINENEEAFADGKTRLSLNSKAVYRIVRPKNGEISKNIAKSITGSLSGIKSGITFEMKDDKYPLQQKKEILVGYTSMDETASVCSSLKVGGWTVREVGDKIIVYGTTEKALKDAADYFISHVTTDEKDNIMLDIPKDGYTFIGSEPFFNESNPLKDYSIIAANGLNSYATTLKAKIKSTYGVDLKIKAATEAKTEKEIIIGDCGRGIEASILNTSSQKRAGYSIKIIGSKLVFNSNLSSSVGFSVNDFISKYLNNEFSDAFQISGEFSYSSDRCYNIAKATDAEVRIMSFNVLADAFSGSHNGTPTMTDRYPHLTATIFSIMPDVIGFQELDFFNKLKNTLSSDYTMINTSVAGGQCWNCIAYNKNTLTLVENGTLKFSHTNQDVKHKNISWAVFKTKNTNETFVFVNSHWDVSTKVPDYRPEQAAETANQVNALRKKYNNCPAFTTGDYNSRSTEVQVSTIKTNATLTDAIDTATEKINNNYSTYHTVNSSPSNGGGKIDYILHTSNAKALLYYNLIVGPAIYASDHCPIFADFKLN